MWAPNKYYLALPKGLPNEPDNWVSVKYTELGHFYKAGNTHTYYPEDFEQVLTLDFYRAVTLCKHYKEIYQQKKRDPNSVEEILKILTALKDDREGNTSIADSDQNQMILKIFRLLDKVEKDDREQISSCDFGHNIKTQQKQ